MKRLLLTALFATTCATFTSPLVGQQKPDRAESSFDLRIEELATSIQKLEEAISGFASPRIELASDYVELHFAEGPANDKIIKSIEDEFRQHTGITGIKSTCGKDGKLVELRLNYKVPKSPAPKTQAPTPPPPPSSTWMSSLLLLRVAKDLGLDERLSVTPDPFHANRIRLSIFGSPRRSASEIIGFAEKIEATLPAAKVVLSSFSEFELSDGLMNHVTLSIATRAGADPTLVSCIPQLRQSTDALLKLGKQHAHIQARVGRITHTEVTLNLQSTVEAAAWVPDVNEYLAPIPGLQDFSVGAIHSNVGNSRVSRMRLSFDQRGRADEKIIKATLLRVGAELREFTNSPGSIKGTIAIHENRMADLTLALLEAKAAIHAATLEIGQAKRQESRSITLTFIYRRS